MYVDDMNNVQLDWAVAQAAKLDYKFNSDYIRTGRSEFILYGDYAGCSTDEIYSPTTDWAQAGPIIEKEFIDVSKSNSHDGWFAVSHNGCYALPKKRHYADGPTLLIAAMRCFVKSKLGPEVELPDD